MSETTKITARVAKDPVKIMRTLGSHVRWHALWILATEGPKSVNDLAARLDRAQHSMSKHLTLLWQAGIVVAVPPPDSDRRKQFFALPPGCLQKTARGLEFGGCVIRQQS
jgi:DNA-binding MarR family transcriptional regulator